MAISIKDRIKQGTNTVGGGTVSLDISYSASGFQDFSVLGNGAQTYYAIEESPSKWEVGIGTYSAGTLSRDTILSSSNANNAVSLGGSGLVFVTYPAEKAVFADSENNVNVTGLVVGATGVKFNDGTIQTTASTSSSSSYDLWTISDGGVNSNISNSGTVRITGAGNTTVSMISGSPSVVTVSGADQDLSSYATTTYVGNASGALQTQITSNDGEIAIVSGLVVTNTTNIASTGATNAADIVIVSGIAAGKDNYDYWRLAANTDTPTNISRTEEVRFTGAGSVTASLDASSNVVRMSGADQDLSSYATVVDLASTGATNAAGIVIVSGLTVTNATNIATNATNIATNVTNIATNSTNISLTGATNAANIATVSGIATGKDNYQYWTVTDGSNSDNIIPTGRVKFTGAGHTTVSYSSNVVTVSGTDQDLSSYATTGYVTGVSGDLQTQITNNIYTWQATGVHSASVSSGGSPTGITISQGASLAISGTSGISVNLGTGTPDKFVVTHDDTSALGPGGIDVSPNYFIRKVQVDEYGHVTGLASAEVTGIGGGAGGSYGYWVASDGSSTTNINSTNTVTLEGEGTTTVTLDGNTYTISGEDTDTDTFYAWNLCGTDVPSGTNVTITGGTGIQVSCGLATTISTTGVMFSGDGYDHWTLQGDGSPCNDSSTNVEKGDTVTIQGAGSTTVCQAGRVVTISGAPTYSGWYAKGIDSGGDLIEDYVIGDLSGVWITGAGSVDVVLRTGVHNAYYTISGIASSSAYSKWRATDGATINNVVDNELVTWTGVGNASVSMDGTVFSISGADTIYLGGSGIEISGTESPYTINGKTAETGVFGMTYLDHDISGADSTTAATPLGVRDYVRTWAAASGYPHWTITDGSNSENISGEDTVKFTGGGATTVAYNTSNNTLTVSSTDNNTTYTAGDGLELDGTEFNVTGMALADSDITISGANGIVAGPVVIPLGGTGTIAGIDASTSVKGVVQLQDSAEDGVVDKAITPNAVYDISGALASAGYLYWNVSDGSTSENISGSDQVIFAGAGATTTAYTTGNNTLTITSTDSNTTYAPGTGLNLDPSTTFNVSGSTIDNSGIVQLTNTILPSPVPADYNGSGFAVTPYAVSGLSGVLAADISTNATNIAATGATNAAAIAAITLDTVTDNGPTTTNNITVGTTTTSGVLTPLVSGSGASSVTFDLSTASTFTYTIDETTTLALSNVTDGQKFMIRLKQDTTGSRGVNWFGTTYWAEGGTAPTLTTSPYHSDVFGFLCTTSGYYDGFVIGQNISGS